MLIRIKNKIIRTFKKPAVNYFSNHSFSQAGEDRILLFLFSTKGIINPSYLDLGVYYPDRISNTHLFYLAGSRGVCIEADETLIPLIKEKRPEDVILNVGVGLNNDTEADFYIFNEKGLSTFNKEEAEYRAGFGTFHIEKVVKVKFKSINKIIEDNFSSCPVLMSLDIEGLDLKVLQSLDLERFPIPVICVETCTYSETHIKLKDNSIIDFMIKKGYFIYADTYINTIFVNENWFYG